MIVTINTYIITHWRLHVNESSQLMRKLDNSYVTMDDRIKFSIH